MPTNNCTGFPQQVAVSHQKYRIATTATDNRELEVQPVEDDDDDDEAEDPDDDDEDQRVPQGFGIARSASSSRMRTLFRFIRRTRSLTFSLYEAVISGKTPKLRIPEFQKGLARSFTPYLTYTTLAYPFWNSGTGV